MIIVLHGFGSNGEASSTCKLIKQAFPEETVLTPTYDSADPDKAHKQLRRFLLDNVKIEDELMFVGISLGGFWARHFANEYAGSVLVMLNPSIMPAYNLQKRIGENQDYVTGETFMLTEDNVYAYRKFTGLKDRVEMGIYLVVASDDDVIDHRIAYDKYKGRADVNMTSNGGHRLQGQEDLVINTITRALNTYQ